MTKTLRTADLPVQRWFNWHQKDIADLRAQLAAVDAGRIGQLKVVLAALEEARPSHELLSPTGLIHPDGSAELRWHRAYDAPYNAVAVLHSLPFCEPARAADGSQSLQEPAFPAARPALPCLSWIGSRYFRRPS